MGQWDRLGRKEGRTSMIQYARTRTSSSSERHKWQILHMIEEDVRSPQQQVAGTALGQQLRVCTQISRQEREESIEVYLRIEKDFYIRQKLAKDTCSSLCSSLPKVSSLFTHFISDNNGTKQTFLWAKKMDKRLTR